jgi:hypothetical protein
MSGIVNPFPVLLEQIMITKTTFQLCNLSSELLLNGKTFLLLETISTANFLEKVESNMTYRLTWMFSI